MMKFCEAFYSSFASTDDILRLSTFNSKNDQQEVRS